MNRLDQMGVQRWRLREDLIDKQMTQPLKHANRQQISAASNQELSQSEQGAHSRGRRDLKTYSWSDLSALLTGGELCSACKSSNPILGEGDQNAAWMIIFDSPSRQDSDKQHLLYGRVGQLFDAILQAVGLDRQTIYLTSVFKCPPAEDLAVIAHCDALVHQQIALVKPRVILTLGEFTSQYIIKSNEDLTMLRHAEQQCSRQGIPIVPTFSLTQLLDTPALKKETWQDLKRCLRINKDSS